MTVTQTEAAGTGNRYRVYLDGQFAFVLYKGELSRYHIRPGRELEPKELEEIRALVIKRARLRAMKLLEISDRSESALRKKLTDSGYTEEIAEDAVSYVKSFGYIDDRRLAANLVDSRKGQKSRAELKAWLMGKGLSKEQTEEALAASYTGSDAREAIQRLARKRHFDPGSATAPEKQRFCAYLARKGFRYEDIRQVIQVSDWNA
ncbi:regulatory protein RecX [Mordavella massiliensis]|uniref:Regulatory protein RecX n=1 Tax=Mordavella massiliensis TaxID=1871024 RepID=A0A939BGH8_9CLOT|nr:regulatory protein RecX [Mordavella massiliensis]MBM6947711.1 regulatory protein RecX [Mordavella massiliensis]